MIGATFCSGIGAPEIAAPWVDWRLASEIAPFPRAVLEQRLAYKTPENQNQGDPLLWGDMATITPGLWRDHGIPLPELIVAGTPCQSFSIAGMRRGLNDDRGNLTLKFVEIMHDIQSARHDGQLVVLWENVPGVLSDKGNAFGCFLAGAVGADHAFTTPDGESWPGAGMVEGPRARAAWRVLNAQYFGVPQRRRRVFVVFDFGNRIDPAKVLFEPRSLHRDSAPGRETGQDVAGTLDASTGGASGKDWQSAKIVVQGHHGDLAGTVSAKWAKGSGGPAGNETQNMVAFDCKGTQMQTGRAAPPLRAMGHDGSHRNGGGHAAIAIQERAVSDNPNAGPDGKGVRDDDTAFTLEARPTSQAVAFKPSHFTRGKDGAPSETFPPLTADADKGDQDPVIAAFDLRGRDGGALPEGPHDTANLRAASSGSSRSDITHDAIVRRLTPTECARLQGFPDDHTAITYRGKPAADGPQYKAYGNSMAVPCIVWILDRIREEFEAGAGAKSLNRTERNAR